jgi:hypothetical protein
MNNDALLEKQREIIRTIKSCNHQLKEAVKAHQQIEPILGKLRLNVELEPKLPLSNENSSFSKSDLRKQASEVVTSLFNIQEADTTIEKIRTRRSNTTIVTLISLFFLLLFFLCCCLILTDIQNS